MSLTITEDCIYCDICRSACPNNAISAGDEHYIIDPNLCTECVGHYDEPQCQQICPADCIPLLPELAESKEQLWNKFLIITS